MRKLVVLAMSAAMFLGAFVLPAAADSSNGCKGVANAQSKASGNGQTSLAKAAANLGCTTTPDPMACPASTATLAEWTYTGTLGEPYQHGYPTWTGSWTSTGTGATITNGDAGGFYWTAAPGTVTHIVLKSFTGEIVTIGTPDPVSQNLLTNRTGINVVRFCGSTA